MTRYAGRHRASGHPGRHAAPPVPRRVAHDRAATPELHLGAPTPSIEELSADLASSRSRSARTFGVAAAVAVLSVGAVDYATSDGGLAPVSPSDLPTDAALQAVGPSTAGEDVAAERLEARNILADTNAVAARAASQAASDAATKAAGEAAAKAAADAAAAEAQRQAAAAKAARDAQRQSLIENARRDPRSAARAMLGDFGFGDSQFSCLDKLWTRESNWSYTATNRFSGAYGIPQALPASKMATVGTDYRTNPVTQIKWGLGYIRQVYGTPCGAWGHSQSTGWY
jgi:hypothetical protein